MKSSFLTKSSGIESSELREVAPSVFASKPWEKVSSRYSFLPTSEILETMKKETGLIPYSVMQAATRIEGKQGYTKHMLRLRLPNAPIVLGGVPECVLINSHDRASSFIIGAGVFRFICLNGLMVSVGPESKYKVIHYATNMQTVMDAVAKVIGSFPLIADRVARFSNIHLDLEQQRRLAEMALGLRYESDKVPFHHSRLLEKRRYQDDKHDLWTVTNVIQENLLQGQSALRGAQRGSRVVRSIDANMKLNQGIWQLAEQFSTE